MLTFFSKDTELGEIFQEGYVSYYHSKSGYKTEVLPKSVYNAGVKKYSVEDLRKAEKEYRKISRFMKEEASHLFELHHDSQYGRNMNARMVGVPNVGVKDMSFFTFHLQRGLVYNLPYNNINKVLDMPVYNEAVNENNKGIKVKTAIDILRKVIVRLDEMGISREAQPRYLYVMAFLKGLTWKDSILEYAESDLTFDELIFAFNSTLMQYNKGPLPVEHVRDWKNLPIEWVVKMISTEGR